MTDVTRHRLPAVRIAESVAGELRHKILRGDFPEGSLLPKQDELVDEFGVSYPSLREALRILETERLITVRRGKVGGSEVHRPNAASAGYSIGLALAAERVHLGDLADALMILEPMCVARCAGRKDRKRVVSSLVKNIRESETLIDDEVAFTHTTRQFHELQVTFAGNDTLRLVVQSLVSLWSAQEETWAERLTRSGDYFTMKERREVLDAHSVIAADVERGDAAAAERHARSHLSATQKLFLERFNDQVIDVTSIRGRTGFRSANGRRGL